MECGHYLSLNSRELPGGVFGAYGGHTALLNDLLKNPGANINYAILGAAIGGRTELLLNELLKNPGDTNINCAILGAARGGHTALLNKLLAESGANINQAILGAAIGGHTALLNKLLALAESGANINYTYATYGAAMGGHTALLNELLKNPGDTNIDEAIHGAARGGHTALLNELLAKPGADIFYALYGAEENDQFKRKEKESIFLWCGKIDNNAFSTEALQILVEDEKDSSRTERQFECYRSRIKQHVKHQLAFIHPEMTKSYLSALILLSEVIIRKDKLAIKKEKLHLEAQNPTVAISYDILIDIIFPYILPAKGRNELEAYGLFLLKEFFRACLSNYTTVPWWWWCSLLFIPHRERANNLNRALESDHNPEQLKKLVKNEVEYFSDSMYPIENGSECNRPCINKKEESYFRIISMFNNMINDKKYSYPKFGAYGGSN